MSNTLRKLSQTTRPSRMAINDCSEVVVLEDHLGYIISYVDTDSQTSHPVSFQFSSVVLEASILFVKH
jgi:hypothetical protein